MTEQKRFKNIREPVSIKVFDTGSDVVEVKENLGLFDIYVNDLKVETFKTKNMALEIAEQAAEALGK